MAFFKLLLLDQLLVDYLKSLQTGDGIYTLDEFEKEFTLNKLPGSNNAPRCHMFIKKSSMQCQDLCMDSKWLVDLNMKSSKITIVIGEAVVRCDDLGFILRISGRISIFDVNIDAPYKLLVGGSGISDIVLKIAVRKIWSGIKLSVNGTDHSRLANILLSSNNSHAASNLLNAAFLLQKENIKDLLNKCYRAVFET